MVGALRRCARGAIRRPVADAAVELLGKKVPPDEVRRAVLDGVPMSELKTWERLRAGGAALPR